MSKVEYPELYLHSVNKKIIELMKQLYANDYKSELNNLKSILKKLGTLQILNDRYTIAVSGLQNVGKTTLMKKNYNLPNEILPENQGRGEKIPVLITEENNQSSFSTYVIEINESNSFDILSREITWDEFNQLALDPHPECIMLELKVPEKLFKGTSKSFILLPGIEEVKADWQDLVSISLIGSASCIFLFTATEYANDHNRKVIDDKIKEGFQAAKPIFILSKSDQSQDYNHSFKEKVIQDFKLTDETDRVICTGIKNTEQWIKELESSLRQYSSTTRTFRIRQIESLKQILESLSDSICILNNTLELNTITGEISPPNRVIVKVNSLLEETKTRTRKKFKKKIEEIISSHIDDPIKKINNSIIDKRIWKKIKENFVGESLEEKCKFEEEIKKAWNDEHPEYFMLTAIQNLCNEVLTTEFKKFVPNKNLKLLPASNHKSNTPSNSDDPSKLFVQDMNFIISLNSNEVSESGQLKLSKNFEQNLEHLPIIALTLLTTEACGIKSIQLPQKEGNKGESLQLKLDDSMQTAFKTVKENIIPIAALILGVDVAADGEADIVKNLSKAFSAGVLSGFGWTIAGLAATYLFVDTIKMINKYELEQSEYGKSIITKFSESYKQHALDKFDDFMDSLIRHINGKMREFYHLDKQLAKNMLLTKALADANESAYQLREHLPIMI